MKSLALPNEFGWEYVAAWTVMVSFGYNTSVMAQRYFSVDTEASARKAALLCAGLFTSGALIWFIPPMVMRILYPDLRAIWPEAAHPQEASYAIASLTLLPNGLIGIMMAAMFSATMSSLSGLFNLHAAIISRDIYRTLFAPQAGERQLMVVGWIATVTVGTVMTLLAIVMASRGESVFSVMLTFNTIISLAYGPPALLGLVVKRTPAWSGLASFAVSLLLGCLGNFVYDWSLIESVVIIVPISVAIFVATAAFGERDVAASGRRDALFARLSRPVDVRTELQDRPDLTNVVFTFLSRVTGAVGLLSAPLIAMAPPADRAVAATYVAVTLALAGLLRLIRGPRSPGAPALVGAEPVASPPR
jgi:Na+/proline symporter